MNIAVIDVVLVLICLLYAAVGYRRGLLLTVLSTVGFLGGALLAVAFLPAVVADLVSADRSEMRPFLLLVLVLACGALGQVLFTRLGRGAHLLLHRSPAGVLDAALGAVVTVVVGLVVLWFAAGLLRIAAPGPIAQAVSRSEVLAAVDEAMPASSERLLGQAVVTLDRYGFPRVFDGLTAEPITPVQPARAGEAATEAVRDAASSVVRIDALAMSCGRSQEGSGWVAEPGLVVTNAHVVAGAERVSVIADGDRHRAEVVAFDPDRDLAVLDVEELSATPLRLGADLSHGDVAAVAGYPLGGPAQIDSARVRGQVTAQGDDIYGTGRVAREVYALNTQIQAGNSGGPLLSTDGRVSGVIFAKSLDDDETAYALTLDELRPVLREADRDDAPVGTGRCAA